MTSGHMPAILSGYRLMWMTVMFDLPVTTKAERYAATQFRNFLLDQGFEMAQFSVYMRCCASKQHTETLTRRIAGATPERGKVDIVYFTDKQYENIVSFRGNKRQKSRTNPDQFSLF